MKIYKIEFNSTDYDQYDSFIVRAEDEKAVEELVLAQNPKVENGRHCFVDWDMGFTITEITQDGEPEIILGSFNAG